MADLFCCSCFKNEAYSEVSIGKLYEEKIRKILNGEDGDENEFSIWLLKYRDAGGICAGASMCPYRDRRDGINYYGCLMPNGWKWVVKVDKRNTDYDDKSSFVNGRITVFNGGDIQDTKMFKSMLKLV